MAFKPVVWVLASSVTDIAVVSLLALSGTLMAPIPLRLVEAGFLAAAGFVLILDQIKLRIMPAFSVE